MTDHLTVVDHPLVQHKLTLMRESRTSTAQFRQLLREISLLLAYEVTRGLPMTTRTIETPMCSMEAPQIEGKKLALVSILRAGNGLLDGILELIPAARVGFVGLYRSVHGRCCRTCVPEHLFRQRDDPRNNHGVADWGYIGVDSSLCWDRANGTGLGCCEKGG
ncbi:MAG: uracil phosphoribosyltransferase, partial [Marivivens sp.]|nr:uracil phosphoribosyltransferase [Marivivens sp.]